MKLNDLVKDINISVEDYYYGFYDVPEDTQLKNAKKVFGTANGNKKIFILESSTFNDFEEVKMEVVDSEKSRAAFEDLKSKAFYLILMKKKETEKNFIAEEVFTSLDEAIKYSKEFIKN